MTLTAMVLTCCFVGLGLYDIVAAWRGGVNSTISRAMQQAGFRSPTVCFVLGGLFGHIFLNMDFDGRKTNEDILMISLIVAVVCTCCGWAAGRTSKI